MTCIRIEHGFVCSSDYHKLRLRDGQSVFMLWHNYCGPTFYRDSNLLREIEDWWDNNQICDAFNWWKDRGMKS